MAQVIYVPGAAPPENDGEQRVIKAFKDGLPDTYILYPGVQVVHQGRTDDIDLLVLTEHSLVVVEVKDIGGHLVIDNGACYVNDNPRPQPFIVTSSKAKRLKSRLRGADPALGGLWVAALVVLARQPASLTITPDSLRQSIVDIPRAIAVLKDPDRLGLKPDVRLGHLRANIQRQLNLTRGRTRNVRFGPYVCRELLDRSDDEDVWSAEHEVTGELVEIRHIGRNPANQTKRVAEAKGELLALRAIGDHPSIVGPRDVLPQDDGSIVLIHEPRQGLTLAELLDGGAEIPADRVLLDVTAAIAYAHQHDVAHRRLAPRWIEVREDAVVVRGFSLTTGGRPQPPAATVLIEEDAAFLAPEVVARQVAGKPADIYSLGKLITLLKPDDELMGRLGARLAVVPVQSRVLPSDRYVLEALRQVFGVEPTGAPVAEAPAVRAAPKVDEEGRLLEGAAFGPYVVISHLGSGGFSDVYLVRGDLGDSYALKVFRGDDAERFVKHEYEILRGIDDPHVVAVRFAGHHPLGWYMVSEYLDGETLEARIDDFSGTSDLDQSLLIGYELLGALKTLHDADIIHRDVKPANIVLVEGRGAVLFDFGVAATPEHQIDGVTFAYRPPGIRPGAKDPDLDLFAAGVVLCELMTGEHPYPDREPHGGGAPDLSGLPTAVAEVLGRAVDPDRAKRYSSADEFMAALEPFIDRTGEVRVERRNLYRKVERYIAEGEYEKAAELCLPHWHRLKQRVEIGRRAQSGELIAGVRVAFAGEGVEPVYLLDGTAREDARTWIYHVTGLTGLTVDVRIAEHPNGAAQIAVVDAYGSADCFQELVNRLRHGINPCAEGFVMRLRYTYRPPSPGRVSQRRADSVGELSDRAGVDLEAELRGSGAQAVGTRESLGLVEPRKERHQVAVLAPAAVRNGVMLRAYLLTVVVPLARELGLLVDQDA